MTRHTHPSDGMPSVDAPARRVGRLRPSWLLLVIAVIVLLGGGVRVLVIGAGEPYPWHEEMPERAATVQLADLPAATADLYRYASAHAADFTQLPCYCGCDRTLGHADLADCFMSAGGDWDAHGATCGICTAEAMQARTELDAGTPVRTVRQHIVRQFDDGNPMSTWSQA